MPARFLVVAALLAAVAALAAPAAALAQLAPVSPESPNADGIRDSYLFVSIFVVAIFVLVEGLLIAFVLRYRRRRRERFEDGADVHGATKLELAWTAFPVVVLFLIAAFLFVELPGIVDEPSAGPGEALEVRVTGRQFSWQYEYPNGAVAVDRLRAPAGVPVRLELTAPDTDVIHSWWIPALGGKIDAIPGRITDTWFEAERPGLYRGQCAELCGAEHARMLAVVEVLPEDEFDAWLAQRRAEQSASEGSLALGEETWEGVCAKCHGLAGEGGIGPRLAGSATLADPRALETIVRNGRRAMPAVGAGWSDAQMDSLTTYLRERPPSGNQG
ncbi:MAG TPA: cytochrome c oxidase subunit II [Gaiellaceae bacterium]|nr:cytochrome c oxidase subunit II [Gaiellaceae bacterium]